MIMSNEQLKNTTNEVKSNLKITQQSFASQDVEREIIARIVEQNGPGSLQRDLKSNDFGEVLAGVSMREELRLSRYRFRLRC
jgi:hypothetical protein